MVLIVERESRVPRERMREEIRDLNSTGPIMYRYSLYATIETLSTGLRSRVSSAQIETRARRFEVRDFSSTVRSLAVARDRARDPVEFSDRDNDLVMHRDRDMDMVHLDRDFNVSAWAYGQPGTAEPETYACLKCLNGHQGLRSRVSGAQIETRARRFEVRDFSRRRKEKINDDEKMRGRVFERLRDRTIIEENHELRGETKRNQIFKGSLQCIERAFKVPPITYTYLYHLSSYCLYIRVIRQLKVKKLKEDFGFTKPIVLV
ncbi:hypothetical protein Syun_014319 [Stephania yunnanensis]|uniref:Uncharacterized protein n=1 Tax=Stephania yunnanensis TaxID=152371 RepID=A0AAP0JJI2_9MAGN